MVIASHGDLIKDGVIKMTISREESCLTGRHFCLPVYLKKYWLKQSCFTLAKPHRVRTIPHVRALDSPHNTATAVPKSPRTDKLYRFFAH